VAFDDPLYNTLDEAAAASAIAALPAGSVVVHVANGAHQEAYTLSGISDGGIFVASSNNGPIRHFAGNYFPEASTIPVPLELGYALVDNPSRITERIGFPTHYDAWLVDPRQKLYIEAYGFLAKCGRFDGVLDHFLAFDAGGTRIQKQLEQSYLPANSLVPTWGVRIDNNRWYTEQVAWPWVQVFGH